MNGAFDFGLGPQGAQGDKTHQDHITTVSSCSCQFPDCVGVPCKHMSRVYIQEHTKVGQHPMPPDVVSVHWHCKTAQERPRLTAESLGVPVKRAAAAHNSDAPLTLSERSALLVANFRVLAQMASQTQVCSDVWH